MSQDQKEPEIVIYTALFGEEDQLWSAPPVFMGSGVKYIAFTEKPRRELGLWSGTGNNVSFIPGTGGITTPSPVWEQRIVKAHRGPIRSARRCKILAHKMLPRASLSIWIDANVRLLVSPEVVLRDWFGESDFAAMEHPSRQCLYKEAQVCEELGKDSPANIRPQVIAYRKEKMPKNWGLPATGFIVRRHTPKVQALNTAWWSQVDKYSCRDQISLPYVCWKLGMRWSILPGYVLRDERYWYNRHGKVP